MRHEVERRTGREPVFVSRWTAVMLHGSSSTLWDSPSHWAMRKSRLIFFFYAECKRTECNGSAGRLCSLSRVCRSVRTDRHLFIKATFPPTWHRQFNSPLFTGVKPTSTRTIFYSKPRNRSLACYIWGKRKIKKIPSLHTRKLSPVNIGRCRFLSLAVLH